MSPKPSRKKSELKAQTGTTVPFERFWQWVQAHPNCIVRAGTPDVVLFDDEDLHWHFGVESDEVFLVQVIRGKTIMGELLLQPAEIAYVQMEAQDDEEYLFELIAETPTERVSVYHFVLSHGYDEEEPVTPGRWTH